MNYYSLKKLIFFNEGVLVKKKIEIGTNVKGHGLE